MPSSPRGVCRLSGQKNGYAHTVGFRADVGIGPYKKTCVFSVGGDAHIAPRVRHQSGPKKTNEPLPASFPSDEGIRSYNL